MSSSRLRRRWLHLCDLRDVASSNIVEPVRVLNSRFADSGAPRPGNPLERCPRFTRNLPANQKMSEMLRTGPCHKMCLPALDRLPAKYLKQLPTGRPAVCTLVVAALGVASRKTQALDFKVDVPALQLQRLTEAQPE